MDILMLITIIFIGLLVLLFPVMGVILLVQGMGTNNIEQTIIGLLIIMISFLAFNVIKVITNYTLCSIILSIFIII